MYYMFTLSLGQLLSDTMFMSRKNTWREKVLHEFTKIALAAPAGTFLYFKTMSLLTKMVILVYCFM